MKTSLFLLTLFMLLSCKKEHEFEDKLNLKPKLSGNWIAKAFDGELHEQWRLGTEGWMEQRGYYIEKGDTAYAAVTQIKKVANDVILLSVIKNANPKVFKAIDLDENKMVFKNDDYKNPYQVTYEFLSDSSYRRTITGTENDSVVTYKFNFQRKE